MKRIKISNDEIRECIEAENYEFPKYASQIINWANQISQGTRPKIVGQMTDLIEEFEGKTIDEWEQWYLSKYPNAIKDASDKIYDMLDKFKEVILKIDRKMVQDWVRDLVVLKTFLGLKFQKAILTKIASSLNTDFKLATPAEESKGIDGYIGGTPVSIKPSTYKSQKLTLSEEIDVSIIYYDKKKTELVVEFDI